MKHLLYSFLFLATINSPAQKQSVSVDTNYIQTLVDSCRNLQGNLNSKESIELGENTITLIEMSLPVTDAKTQTRLKFRQATLLRTIGNAYKDLADLPNALIFYQKCFKVAKEINDKTNLGGALLNTGIVYHELHEYEKALEYIEQSEKIFEKIGSKRGLAYCFQSFGGVYSDLSQDSLALEFYEESLKMFTEINDKFNVATQLNNMAQIYKKQKKYSEALDNYKFSLRMFEEIGDSSGAAISLAGLGDIYENFEKNLKIAEKFYMRSLANAELSLKKQVLNALKDLYQRQSRYKEAFVMYDRYNLIKDSISVQQNAEEIRRREMQSDFEGRQAKLRAEKEKQAVMAAAESKKQKMIIWSVVSGFLLVALFAGFIFRSLRITRKQKIIIETKNRETEEQKKIIEQKNKDITDSITYAKRIQQAKLPKKEEISFLLPKSFVLFKPKDIVSGDFYFFYCSTDYKSVLLAAADCTGHGVPGGFMSMIGSEKLDDAVSQSSDVSEILQFVNKGIKNSLHQSESDESTRDGMDIALVRLDLQSFGNGTLHYSGANRPLWLFNPDRKQWPANFIPFKCSDLQGFSKSDGNPQNEGLAAGAEIKGTKKAIGGFTEDEQHFESHTIPLMQGDTFYLFSDGFADQDGGEKGKKLMTKFFKKLLLDIQNLSMQEQEKYLSEFIDNWRGNRPQLDDILVIGVRI